MSKERLAATLCCLGAAGCQPLEANPIDFRASGRLEVEPLGQTGQVASELRLTATASHADIVWSEVHSSGSNVVAASLLLEKGQRLDEADELSPTVLLGGRATEIAVDSVGDEATVVWRQQLPNGTSQVHRALRSSDHWAIPRGAAYALSPAGSNAFRPDVAYCGEGHSVVVWDQNRGSSAIGVLSAFFVGSDLVTDLSPDKYLSPDIQFSNEPKVACTSGGEATLAWYQARASTLEVFVTEGDRRRGFRAVDTPLRSGAAAGEVSVARNAFGRRAVAWREELSEDATDMFVATSDDGVHWVTTRSTGFAWVLGTHTMITEDAETIVVFMAAKPGGNAGSYVWRLPNDEAASLTRITPAEERGFSPSSTLLSPCGELVVSEVRATEDGSLWSVVASVQDGAASTPREVLLATDVPGQLGEPQVAATGTGTALLAWLVGGRVSAARLSSGADCL